MWSRLLEWCADAFGTTRRTRWLSFVVMLYLAMTLSIVFGVRWGLTEALLPFVLGIVVAPYVAQGVVRARKELWRAARLDLDDPDQRPRLMQSYRPLIAPTAAALGRLALAVDHARRGALADAHDLLPLIDRALLRDEEVRLLEAVRAMVSLGLGEGHRAAQQAVLAVPSGSEPLDAALGRAIVTDAWRDPKRLAAIDEAWDREGIGLDQEGALPRLRVLVKMRALGGEVSSLAPSAARSLADDARAIGDEELAADLIAHSHTASYR